MITDAYKYAEGATVTDEDGKIHRVRSYEVDLLAKIDRFGVEAVLGRKTFYIRELRRLLFAENIVSAYHRRAASSNWAAWALDNPEMSEILVEAEKLCQNP